VLRPWQFIATIFVMVAFAVLSQVIVFVMTRRFNWLTVLMLKE
jgi:hypothetical protein